MSNNSNDTTTNNDVSKHDDADTEQSKQQQQQRTSGTTTYKPGDVILTLYGVGVIVAVSNTANDNNYYTVRLWRIPGKSISSCAIAYLIPSCVSHSPINIYLCTYWNIHIKMYTSIYIFCVSF